MSFSSLTGEGRLEGSTDPQGFMISFSPVNRTFETVLLLQEQYVMYTETSPHVDY